MSGFLFQLCKSTYMHVETRGRFPGVFLYCCLPYCLETGSFTELEAHCLVRLVDQWASGICCLHPATLEF